MRKNYFKNKRAKKTLINLHKTSILFSKKSQFCEEQISFPTKLGVWKIF